MFVRCPCCNELIHIQVSVTHVAQQEDHVRRLLNNWLGLTGWGAFEEEMMTGRIAQHGVETVEDAIKECLKARARNWRYLDKVLDTRSNRPGPTEPDDGSLEALMSLIPDDASAAPTTKPANQVKPSAERTDYLRQCEDLF
jgi:hypothetical protein